MDSKVISYDLMKPGQDYESLYALLKKYQGWAKITESCWFIKTTDSCVKVRNDLRTVLDGNDRIFVGTLSGEAAWANIICEDEYLKKTI